MFSVQQAPRTLAVLVAVGIAAIMAALAALS